jgi:hypothetical protein
MSQKVVTPMFLTKEIAETAVEGAVRAFFIREKKKHRSKKKTRKHMPFGRNCYVAIYVLSYPTGENGRADYTQPAQYSFLYGKAFGCRDKWKHDFEDIARCKAVKGERSDQPHLLFPGETIYWGNVEMDGIRIGCSGFASEDDKKISRGTGRRLIRLAKAKHDKFMQTYKEDFLPWSLAERK